MWLAAVTSTDVAYIDARPGLRARRHRHGAGVLAGRQRDPRRGQAAARRARPRARTTRSASSAASSASRCWPRCSARPAATSPARRSSTASARRCGSARRCWPPARSRRCSCPGKPRAGAASAAARWCRCRPALEEPADDPPRPASSQLPLPLSQLALEVVRADPQPVPEVEPMRVLAVLADARVEVELRAAAAPRLVLQPREQAVGEAAAAVRLGGDEVVDVEVAAPGEELVDAEARDGGGLLGAVLERAERAGSRPARRRSSTLPDERLGAARGPGRSCSSVRAARAVSPGPSSRTVTATRQRTQ